MAERVDPEEARRRLCMLGDVLRDTVIASRGIDMSVIEGKTEADVIYAIDKITDDALVDWFDANWTDVELVSEGLEEPIVLGEPRWTVIVDTVDGTRGLMYDKRPAWALAAAAPHGGTLRDIAAAAMTELPTTKQGLTDQVSAVRGEGLVSERIDLRTGARAPLALRPSTATDLEHGFAQVAKFFPPGKADLVAIEAALFDHLGATEVFDDEYICSGGQLYELLGGRDRFTAELRPLVDPAAIACHPYDLCTAMLLEEGGGVVTDPWGAPLDVPLDTTTPVAWVGFANPVLAATVGPVLADVLRDAGYGPPRP
ncbi:MAG: hypothetical protein JNK12_06230 [Acidimicrobiales bacterium]|nr:hypothetical protein [Acidimicrobiales bacterium]